MSIQRFSSEKEKHQHSLQTLELLQRYDTFMESVDTVVDIGCGKEGYDLAWWATRTTRDDDPIPLNIKCTGVDIVDSCKAAYKYDNAAYYKHDFEEPFDGDKRYDVVWAHNVFQRSLAPIQTLMNWRDITTEGGMLALTIPHYTNFEFNRVAFVTPDFGYYNHTITSLIYMLAVAGWDCKGGFFKKLPGDPWISAVVYNTSEKKRNPKTTRWYDLLETDLLPDTAKVSINKYGYLRQQDLTLQWLDKNFIWMGHE